MIQLFMKRSGSPVIVPLNLPASHDAMTEAASQLDEASRAGKTEIVEIKSVIADLQMCIRDISITEEEPTSQGDTVRFEAVKWRGPLGAYAFTDCKSTRGADGVWGAYSVGAEAIS